MEAVMESWRHVWRVASKMISDEGLAALKKAIEDDDQRLVQGATTVPPPLMAVQDWPCEGACLIGYVGWKGDGLDTVGEIDTFFARMCHDIDTALGEPAGIRHLLNTFDEWPREVMRGELLPEVELALASRSESREDQEHPGRQGRVP